MRIVHYCQHVLGVGHFHRSLEIAKALAPHDVVFVTGGAPMAFDPPDNVRQVQLPGLMMDADFSRFIPVEEGADVDELLVRRLAQFRALMADVRPDVFLVELFPFGRKKFGFELLPILETAKAGEYGLCKTVCSLRDILVEKKDQAKFEKEYSRRSIPCSIVCSSMPTPHWSGSKRPFPLPQTSPCRSTTLAMSHPDPLPAQARP